MRNILTSFISEDFTTDELAVSDWIYLFRNPINGLYKIGIAIDPIDRLRAIKNSSGNQKIEILAALQINEILSTPQIERFIHAFFNDQRRVGEWFDLKADDLAQLRSLYRYVKANYAIGMIESDHAETFIYNNSEYLEHFQKSTIMKVSA
jgi:pantoate kinase